MRKPFVVALCVLGFGSVVVAQSKIDTKWHCEKPSGLYKFDVGDVPDHSYLILQGTCNATASDSNFAEKTGAYTEFQEVWKASMTFHGRFNVTMDNADKVFYTYEGSGSTANNNLPPNKWKIASGTGKYKGIKGMGNCSGKQNTDQSSDWTCTGTYSMGK